MGCCLSLVNSGNTNVYLKSCGFHRPVYEIAEKPIQIFTCFINAKRF